MGLLDTPKLTQEQFDKMRLSDKLSVRLVSKKKARQQRKKARQERLKAMGVSGVTKYGRPIKYSEYIKSPYWKEQRQYSLSFFKNKCALCNNKAETVHHRSYEFKGVKEDENLVALCWTCHNLFHQNFEYSKKAHKFDKTS